MAEKHKGTTVSGDDVCHCYQGGGFHPRNSCGPNCECCDPGGNRAIEDMIRRPIPNDNMYPIYEGKGQPTYPAYISAMLCPINPNSPIITTYGVIDGITPNPSHIGKKIGIFFGGGNVTLKVMGIPGFPASLPANFVVPPTKHFTTNTTTPCPIFPSDGYNGDGVGTQEPEEYSNYSIAPTGLPAPRTDYYADDIISKQFPNTCGPFPDTGNCGEAISTFKGVITGNKSHSSGDGSINYEVEWMDDNGNLTNTLSYVSTHQIFLVSRDQLAHERRLAELNANLLEPQSQADCPSQTNFVPSVRPICGPNEKCASRPAYCIAEEPQPKEIDNKPKTAGFGDKGILPIILIAGAMYWLYTKNN